MQSSLQIKGKISINLFEKNDDNNEENGGGRKEVIVSVNDTGSRINSEIFPRLFSKFASKSYQGTGLGLFICKSIIEAHGGRIWAENNDVSEDKSGGATITFSLPTAAPNTLIMLILLNPSSFPIYEYFNKK